MSTVRFQRVGQVAGASYPANPLTDIRQVVEPPAGPHRDFLTSLGWPFSGDARAAYRTTCLSRTYFELQDAGLHRISPERLEKLKAIYAGMGHPAGQEVVRWLSGEYQVTDEMVQTQ